MIALLPCSISVASSVTLFLLPFTLLLSIIAHSVYQTPVHDRTKVDKITECVKPLTDYISFAAIYLALGWGEPFVDIFL